MQLLRYCFSFGGANNSWHISSAGRLAATFDMVSSVSSLNSEVEDKRDFEILKRQLSRTPSPSPISPSSSGSSSRTSPIDSDASNEIWPLELHTTFVDHYIIGDVIGSGSYAEVRECINTLSLERNAMKIVCKEYLKRQAPNALRNQLQEIRLLKKLNHPNIISMRECISKESRIFLALEHCTFNLHDLLNETTVSSNNSADDEYLIYNRLCVPIARNLFRQLCMGLGYLHSMGVVHRDIKPKNLLINNCGVLKIIDFGVSHILSLWSRTDLCSNSEGSPLFQAPEVVSGQTHYNGFKVDVWSAGVTLYLMIYGRYPFYDNSLLSLYDKIMTADFETPREVVGNANPALNNLLSLMLTKSSAERLTISQVTNHIWLMLDKSVCDHEYGQRSELNDLLIAVTNQEPLSSSLDLDAGNQAPSASRTTHRDIYRSMNVLPYLYNYHFPNAPIVKSTSKNANSLEKPSLTGTSLSKTYANHENETSDTANMDSKNQIAKNQKDDPHRVLSEDKPVEWGTEVQYKLLKVPQVRANRTGYHRSRRGQLRRRKPNGLSDTVSQSSCLSHNQCRNDPNSDSNSSDD